MRITLNIADELIHKVQRLTGQESKTRAIVAVLEDYVRREKLRKLLALRGKININYDWMEEEAAELKAAEERTAFNNPFTLV